MSAAATAISLDAAVFDDDDDADAAYSGSILLLLPAADLPASLPPR